MIAKTNRPPRRRAFRPLVPVLLGGLWLASVAAHAQSGDAGTNAVTAAARDEFVQQVESLDAMPSPAQPGQAGEASEALRNYVLYPYLEALRLRTPMRFGLPPDDTAVATLLQRDGDQPWTRDLRRDWLLDLARRDAWPLFLRNYLEPRADARLRCERLNALIAAPPGNASAIAALQGSLLSVWMTGAQLPDACVAPFDWARSRGWFKPDLTEQRTRMALDAGNADLADFLLKSLPPERGAGLRTWMRLLRSPDREFDALVAAGPDAIQAVEPAAILAGFTKLSRRSPSGAAARLDALARTCTTPCALAAPATLGQLGRELGLGYAWSRLPESVGAFRNVPDSALDEPGFEWRIRAALWADDWKQALAWIKALPPALATQQRWRYWHARALAERGDKPAAEALYETLAGENGYYPLLASKRLKRGFVPTSVPSPLDPAMQQQLLQMPGMVRARELWLARRNEWSGLEWGELLKSLDKPQAIQAARLAGSWGAYAQMVGAASKAQVYEDYELLYPRPYEAEVRAASKLSNVPADWIYAVMRQESLYDPRAKSKADALGLLQMLLGTARDTARREQQPTPSANDLFMPAINTRLGALHLAELLDLYGNEFVLVLGAYNAGPKPVQRWRPASGTLDADVWIENVPYNETRAYIQRVIWHSAVFGWRATGEPQKLDGIMRAITPGLGASASSGDATP